MRFYPVIAVVMALGACVDPLAGVDRLSDVDVRPQFGAAAALPDAGEVAREGFLGTSAAQGALPAGIAVETPEPKEKTGGFFSNLIQRAAQADPAAAIAADVAQSQSDQSDEAVELAALPSASDAQRSTAGFFGGAPRSVQRSGPDARDVAYGGVVPFGEIARVCEARGKPLGTQVASLGRRGFTLYDSNPELMSKRTFYITGFADDCPRQFSAANALFGAPSFYEQIRFSPAGKHLPLAATDAAYDKVKSSVCRAGKNKPCGSKIDKLDKEAAFVSAYQFNEHNGEWKEFLVHDGEVLAGAVKSF